MHKFMVLCRRSAFLERGHMSSTVLVISHFRCGLVGRRNWGTAAVQALKFCSAWHCRTLFLDFALFVPESLSVPSLFFHLVVLGRLWGYILLQVGLQGRRSPGCSKPSYCWVLLSMLFLIGCILSSHKQLKVHLQYVKPLYQEVASGTADKVFWL